MKNQIFFHILIVILLLILADHLSPGFKLWKNPDDFVEVQNPQKSSSKETAASECLIDCIHSAHDVPLNIPDLTNGATGTEEGEKQMFGAVCSAFSQHKICINRCNKGEEARMAMEALRPLDYICIQHYKEFSDNYPCLIDAKRKIADQCTPVCGPLQRVIDKIVLMQQDVDNKSAKFQIALQLVCNYSNCQNGCHKPILESTCGSAASHLLERLTAFSMSDFVVHMKQFGMNRETIEKCDELRIAVDREIDPEYVQAVQNSLHPDQSLYGPPPMTQFSQAETQNTNFNPFMKPRYYDKAPAQTVENWVHPVVDESEGAFHSDVLIGTTVMVVIVGIICIVSLLIIARKKKLSKPKLDETSSSPSIIGVQSTIVDLDRKATSDIIFPKPDIFVTEKQELF